MWFWINFSPIGQATPPPKKPAEIEESKKMDVTAERKADGSINFLSQFRYLSGLISF